MQTIVYQCDTAMPAQKLPNCCNYKVYEFSGVSVQDSIVGPFQAT